MTGGLQTGLAGKSVLITGGATGIGAAMVAAFADQGAEVTFCDLNASAGQALANRLGALVTFHALDLTELNSVQDFIDTLPRVDVLVNSAANDMRHKLENVTPQDWRNTLSVNLDHQFFCAQAVLSKMRALGGGVILNFSSIAWHEGLQDAVGYVTAKAAIEGLTHALARELGSDNIRVNCLLPGFVRTERQVEKWLTPDLVDTVMDRQCLQRFIEPKEVAMAALFLCSDAASAITNQTLIVDAGWR